MQCKRPCYEFFFYAEKGQQLNVMMTTKTMTMMSWMKIWLIVVVVVFSCHKYQHNYKKCPIKFPNEKRYTWSAHQDMKFMNIIPHTSSHHGIDFPWQFSLSKCICAKHLCCTGLISYWIWIPLEKKHKKLT